MVGREQINGRDRCCRATRHPYTAGRRLAGGLPVRTYLTCGGRSVNALTCEGLKETRSKSRVRCTRKYVRPRAFEPLATAEAVQAELMFDGILAKRRR